MKLLSFQSATCQPCKLMIPIVDSIATSLDIEVENIDIHEQPKIASKYEITAVPTLVLVNDHGEMSRRVGTLARPLILEWLKIYA